MSRGSSARVPGGGGLAVLESVSERHELMVATRGAQCSVLNNWSEDDDISPVWAVTLHWSSA